MRKINFGCGKNNEDGFDGVDVIDFGQKYVFDVRNGAWPWEDSSVDEAKASHFIEHLDGPERIHFVNELYRVLKPGASCQIIAPHWCSCRAYGDLTHKWPPVSEFWFYYLSKDWRDQNAPHNDGYTCNFSSTWGYSVRQDLLVRNVEFQQFALQNYKETAQDIIATIVKV